MAKVVLCVRCAPVGVEILLLGVVDAACERCGTRGGSPELRCYRGDGGASWKTVRQAMGVVQGEPADAVVDCERLYDDSVVADEHARDDSVQAPPGFVFTKMPDDLMPDYLLCSDGVREALGGATLLSDIELTGAEAAVLCRALQMEAAPSAELVRLFRERQLRRKPTGP